MNNITQCPKIAKRPVSHFICAFLLVFAFVPLSAQTIKWQTDNPVVNNAHVQTICNDSKGNVFVLQSDGFLSGYNPDGTINPNYEITGVNGIALDKFDNLWFAGSGILFKYPSSGKIKVVKYINCNATISGLSVDNYENIYLFFTTNYLCPTPYGRNTTENGRRGYLEIMDSAGNIKSTTAVVTLGEDYELSVYNFSVDGSGSAYICLGLINPGCDQPYDYSKIGNDSSLSGSDYLYIAKVNHQGSFSWAKMFNSTEIAIDSIGRVFYSNNAREMIYAEIDSIIGLDSSGNAIKTPAFKASYLSHTISSVPFCPSNIWVDGLGDYYVLSDAAGINSTLIKYDKSGNPVWYHYFENLHINSLSFNEKTHELCFGGISYSNPYEIDYNPYTIKTQYGLLAGVISDDSFVKATTPITIPNTISLYPNPAYNEVNINYSATAASNCNISISDMQGHIITSVVQLQLIAGENSIPFNVSQYGPGVYILTLQTANNVQRVKFVKE